MCVDFIRHMSSAVDWNKHASINLQDKVLKSVFAVQNLFKNIVNSSQSSELLSGVIHQTVEQESVITSISDQLIQITHLVDRLADRENLLETRLKLLD